MLVHEASAPAIADFVLWARSFLDDFRSACVSSPAPLVRPVLKWEAPSPSWFKLNSDAALDFQSMKVGIGVVILDWRGQVAAALSMHVSGVESDASSVIDAIKSKSPPRSELGLIIEDILVFSSSFSVVDFSFRSHLCNSVAHGLAKFGLYSSRPCFWLEETLSCVENLVSSEFSVFP
ncbi:hypothetical protein ACOSQ2_027257 [Xanthoceras sorbifolium]